MILMSTVATYKRPRLPKILYSKTPTTLNVDVYEYEQGLKTKSARQVYVEAARSGSVPTESQILFYSSVAQNIFDYLERKQRVVEVPVPYSQLRKSIKTPAFYNVLRALSVIAVFGFLAMFILNIVANFPVHWTISAIGFTGSVGLAGAIWLSKSYWERNLSF